MTTFSQAALEHMHHVLARHTERREIPGLVAMIACREDLHVEQIGTLAFDNPAPMRRDTIFRIASLSKVIVAVAAMILIEDCVFRLDDSIEPWLPELANRRVLQSLTSDLEDTVPARRPITVRDLLTYRMGFGSVMARPGSFPIQKAIRDGQIGGDRAMLPSDMLGTEEWLRNLGALPWLAQPGEQWMYHVSGDVLGVLIARASRKSLGAYLRERILGPLAMNDTGFYAPPEKIARMPAFYSRNHATGELFLYEDPAKSAWAAQPAFESAGGGLLSTAEDYLAFSRMLLHRGSLGKQRILSPASVTLMTSDQLLPEQRQNAKLFFGEHSSWALGMAVDIGRREIYHSPGRFGWTGGFGTTSYTDPATGLIGILFTQRMMDSPEPPCVFTDFWNLAYAALC